MATEMKFVCAGKDFCTREKHVGAPLLRKVFSCEPNFKTAVITIAAVGFYRLFLNGKELTKGFFAPYISNPDDFVYADEYEVSSLLKQQNVLCILLGNGFSNAMDGGVWDFERAPWRASPKAALRLVCDGELLLSSDESFETHVSPITFDDLRAGERYDARLVREELFCAEYDGASAKRALIAAPPKGEMRLCAAQPVAITERAAPVSVTPCQNGYVYDFGCHGAGVYELRINARAGQTLDLTFAEVLQHGVPDFANTTCGDKSPAGYVQHDVYICREGEQTYTPSFTYHGFRYVFVQGLEQEQATPSLLTALWLTNAAPQTGAFSCDNAVLNGVEACTVRSDRANLVVIPTDCPQREKNGWTGDTFLSAEQFLYHFDCGASLREWLRNVCKAQKPTGQLPGIVPTAGWGFAWGNGPAWDGVLIELTYQLYRFYGDASVVEENIQAILRYFDYLKTKVNESGCIAFGLGDWCETGTLCEDGYSTPNEVTDTLLCIRLAQTAAKLCEVVGKSGASLLAFREELLGAFRKKYLVNGETTVKTQTAQAMAIGCGAVPSVDLPRAHAALKAFVERENGRFRVGVIGAKYLFDALASGGNTELAFGALARNDFPSFGYWLDRGATTLWEAFHRLKDEEGVFEREDGGRILSLNHHFWGSVTAFFYRVIAGIDVLGANMVAIQPHFIESLSNVFARTGNGKNAIAVQWQRKGNSIELSIENHGYSGKILLNEYRFANGLQEAELAEGKRDYVLHRL